MVTLKVGWAMYTDDPILNVDVYEGKAFVKRVKLDGLDQLESFQHLHYPRSRIYWY